MKSEPCTIETPEEANAWIPCDECGGSGDDPGCEWSFCPICDGTGEEPP